MDYEAIERIHNNRVNGNIPDANEQINEYGPSEFFNDYRAWLQHDLSHGPKRRYLLYAEAVESFLLYAERSRPVAPLEPQCNIMGYEQNFQATRVSLLIPRHDHKAFLKQLSIGESEGYESETGKMILHVLNEECEAMQ